MEQKPAFLISRAVVVEPEGPRMQYCSELHLNVLSDDVCTPLVLAGVTAPTHSKTRSIPGDDDPDPGQLQCY